MVGPIEINIPTCIDDYNCNKGFVDRTDHVLHYYIVNKKQFIGTKNLQCILFKCIYQLLIRVHISTLNSQKLKANCYKVAESLSNVVPEELV